jgi:hypothetical protein
VRDWFTPLSPYRGQPPLFEDEEENYWEGLPEPLSILAVSAKRYALYNRLPDGTYRIRKFSSHGVGTWRKRHDYVPPAHIPEPCGDVWTLGGERWQYDRWYEAIAAIDGGTLLDGRDTPTDERGAPRFVVPTESDWLRTPAFHQLTLSTWTLYERYQHVEGMRPFNFLTVLPALSREDTFFRQRAIEQEALAGRISWEDARVMQARYEELVGVAYFAPYAERWEDVRAVRRMDTGEVVEGIKHRTLGEALRAYFQHPEWKSADPRGVGLLPRRRVRVMQHTATGKESNALAKLAAEETDGAIGGREAGIDGAQVFDHGTLQETLSRWSIAELVQVTGLKRSTMRDLRSGKTVEPSPETLRALLHGLSQLDRQTA